MVLRSSSSSNSTRVLGFLGKTLPAMAGNLLYKAAEVSVSWSSSTFSLLWSPRNMLASSASSASSSSLISRNPVLTALLTAYLFSEAVFYVYFHYHLIPRANQHRPLPDAYHDHPQPRDRVDLCRRIIRRLEQRAVRICRDRKQQREGGRNPDNPADEKQGDDDDFTHCFRTVVRDYVSKCYDCVPDQPKAYHRHENDPHAPPLQEEEEEAPKIIPATKESAATTITAKKFSGGGMATTPTTTPTTTTTIFPFPLFLQSGGLARQNTAATCTSMTTTATANSEDESTQEDNNSSNGSSNGSCNPDMTNVDSSESNTFSTSAGFEELCSCLSEMTSIGSSNRSCNTYDDEEEDEEEEMKQREEVQQQQQQQQQDGDDEQPHQEQHDDDVGHTKRVVQQPSRWTIRGLRTPVVTEFLAWAFFAKEPAHLSSEELEAVGQCMETVTELTGLEPNDQHCNSDDSHNNNNEDEKDEAQIVIFDNSGSSEHLQARRLSLENVVNARYRPWILYGMTATGLSLARNVILPRLLGFQKVTATSVDLVAWYRPGSSSGNNDNNGDDNKNKNNNKNNNKKKTVWLFFHGLAPAGPLFYLPMLQAVFGSGHGRQQDLIVFENPSVSCHFTGSDFPSLREEEMVRGVSEILKTTLTGATSPHSHPHHHHENELSSSSSPPPPPGCSLTLMGHSFGSVPITWILRRRNDPDYFPQSLRCSLDHVVLLDPVTLLLSELTVMNRFLYDKRYTKFSVVSSELFIEYYLRRHFCWYNSELWLEDLCCNTDSSKGSNNNNNSQNNTRTTNNHPPCFIRWTIMLSGQDEIVPSPVVQEHISWLKQRHPNLHCNLIYWPQAGHAHCVGLAPLWTQIRSSLFQPRHQQPEKQR